MRRHTRAGSIRSRHSKHRLSDLAKPIHIMSRLWTGLHSEEWSPGRFERFSNYVRKSWVVRRCVALGINERVQDFKLQVGLGANLNSCNARDFTTANSDYPGIRARNTFESSSIPSSSSFTKRYSLTLMNSLYTSGVRQTNSLQADMERLRNGDNSPALLGEPHLLLGFVQRDSTNQVFFIGQISASLSAMQRTIDDYDSMTKREIIKAKQEKGQMYCYRFFWYNNNRHDWILLNRRVQKFRTDYAELRTQFERLKGETAAAVRSYYIYHTLTTLKKLL